MGILEIKKKIINALCEFSANDLPSMCEAIGLRSGTTNEAFKSKRAYVSRRLSEYDLKTIQPVLDKIKGCYDIDIAPISLCIDTYCSELKDKVPIQYFHSQVDVMLANLEPNPYISIGKAKELLETLFKSILDDNNVSYDHSEKLTSLEKKVAHLLNLNVDENSSVLPGVKEVLGGLANIVHGMNELRNNFGDGHGKNLQFTSLPSRYAKLAVGAATTISLFLLETNEAKKNNE